MWVGPNLNMTSVLKKRFGLGKARGKIMWKYQKKTAICKPRSEVPGETKLAETLFLNLQTQNCEKIKFCCLSHQIYGILLWQMNIIPPKPLWLHHSHSLMLYPQFTGWFSWKVNWVKFFLSSKHNVIRVYKITFQVAVMTHRIGGPCFTLQGHFLANMGKKPTL